MEPKDWAVCASQPFESFDRKSENSMLAAVAN